MRFASEAITVVTAVRVETNAALRVLRGPRVLEVGVGCARLGARSYGEIAISCGVAGGLRSSLPTGTVVIPREVLRPDGTRLICDEELVAALCAGARVLGVEPLVDPLVTVPQLVHGAQRQKWAELGYVAVDMETGCINAPRIAAVRVILDTPEREISPAWLRPATALLHPQAWRDLAWLPREAPRCARIAAQVIGAAFP